MSQTQSQVGQARKTKIGTDPEVDRFRTQMVNDLGNPGPEMLNLLESIEARLIICEGTLKDFQERAHTALYQVGAAEKEETVAVR